MIGLPSGTRVWIAAGHTDMRRGFDGLAALVQTALAANAYGGHVFVFRGKRGDWSWTSELGSAALHCLRSNDGTRSQRGARTTILRP